MKKQLAILIAAAMTAVTLTACNTATPESEFVTPRPWQDDVSIARNGSYEKLDYTVNIYDTTAGVADDKRVTIATGTLGFELTESLAYEHTTLDMRYSVTYNEHAADERGLTDAIESTVRFSTGSLAAQYMQKTVTLADRAGVDNLSYKVTANYHGDQTATLERGGATQTLELSKNTSRDNEMMFYLARAQAVSLGASTMFKMYNIYESFAVGKATEYTMYAQAAADTTAIDIGDFVKDFGVEAVTDEQSGKTSYPVSCYSVNIGRSGTKVGPPYTVLYTENAFVSGGRSHYKLPVKITYTEYKNNKAYRYFEYVLNACSFEKPAQ